MIISTIIESNPERANKGRVNNFVKAIADANTIARRAFSVENLRTQLKSFATLPPKADGSPSQIIQIVGHGQPGRISIGETFEGVYEDDTDHFVLDSNPYVYGVLDGAVPDNCEIWLLGCSVGEDAEESTPLVADGTTLMFDLAQMWGVTVRASTGTVVAADFDPVTHEYLHAANLMSVEKIEKLVTGLPPSAAPGLAAGWRWRVSTQPHVAPVAGTALPSPPPLQLLRMNKAPLRGLLAKDFKPVNLVNVDTPLPSFYRREIEPIVELGASPEYEFNALLGNQLGRVEILLNRRLLRFRAPGVVRDFIWSANDAPGLGRALRSLARRGLKLPA